MFHVKHEDSKKELQNYCGITPNKVQCVLFGEKPYMVFLEIVSVGNFESIIDLALDLFFLCKDENKLSNCAYFDLSGICK